MNTPREIMVGRRISRCHRTELASHVGGVFSLNRYARRVATSQRFCESPDDSSRMTLSLTYIVAFAEYANHIQVACIASQKARFSLGRGETSCIQASTTLNSMQGMRTA